MLHVSTADLKKRYRAIRHRFTPPPPAVRRDWLIISSDRDEVEKLEVLRGRIILEDAARASGIRVTVLTGHVRDQRTVVVRDRVIRRLREELGWSSARIGRLLGDRDHTTILASLKRTQRHGKETRGD